MKFTKTWKLKWWQTSVFKASLISFGIAVGVTWPEFWSQYTNLLWVVAAVTGVYITKVWYDQK